MRLNFATRRIITFVWGEGSSWWMTKGLRPTHRPNLGDNNVGENTNSSVHYGPPGMWREKRAMHCRHNRIMILYLYLIFLVRSVFSSFLVKEPFVAQGFFNSRVCEQFSKIAKMPRKVCTQLTCIIVIVPIIKRHHNHEMKIYKVSKEEPATLKNG